MVSTQRESIKVSQTALLLKQEPVIGPEENSSRGKLINNLAMMAHDYCRSTFKNTILNQVVTFYLKLFKSNKFI